MNLRELLLQFSGENDRMLKLEDFITSNASNVTILEATTNSIRLLPTDKRYVNSHINEIIRLLKEYGHEDYEVREESKNIVITI